MKLKQGTQLQGGRYRIEKMLGQGGFGITYLAEQKSPCRKVAIKEFFMSDFCERDVETSQVTLGTSGSREMVQRYLKKFLKEAQNIAELEHRNIVSIIDIFEENGTAYYVMRYCGGGSLADRLKEGPMPENEAIRYIRQVADALSYVHSHNVMHLDVKPANILLDDKGEAVLIDFGISKHYGRDDRATTSTPVGISHGYAPLEQYSKNGVSTFSAATDIYSLGATLYKLVTGVTPPEASEVNDNNLPPLPSRLSAGLCCAIREAMQPRRADRPQSIADFLRLLDATNVHPADEGTKPMIVKEVDKDKTVASGIVKPSQPDKNAVKWMDFAQFCDLGNYPLRFMRTISKRIFSMKFAYVIWTVTALFTLWWIVDDSSSFNSRPLSDVLGVSDARFWWYDDYDNGWNVDDSPGELSIVFYALSAVILLVYPAINSRYHLNVSGIVDIEDTASRYKIIRSSNGLYGLSKWGRKSSRRRLGMRYRDIRRVSEELFIVAESESGNCGLYNAAQKNFIIPIKFDSIELRGGYLYVKNGSDVFKYTDHGYRVVE